MCPQLALYALNPHFSGRTSRIHASRQFRHKVSLEPPSFVSLAFFDLLMFFWCLFCEYLTRNVVHASVSPFLGPSFSHLLQDMRCIFYSIFDRGISQIGSSLLLVYILTLSGSGFRKRSNVIWGRRISFFL